MELTPFASMSGAIVLGSICSCLLFTSCSSDEDPIKSYSNYRITVDAASPVSFTALGETRTITVSASKEICWNGKPSGETEPAKVTASVEGEHFMSESSQTDEDLQLKITARENETEKMQKEKVVLTVQEDIAAETRTVKLNQDAATIEYDSYKMDSYSLLFYPLIGYENIVYAVIRCYRELIQFFFQDFQCISEEAIGQYNYPAFINPKESYLYTLLFLYYNDKPGKPKQSISHTVSIR